MTTTTKTHSISPSATAACRRVLVTAMAFIPHALLSSATSTFAQPRLIQCLGIQTPRICLNKLQRQSSAKLFTAPPTTFVLGKWPTSAIPMAAASMDHKQVLDSKSECPPLFDGTTRLYFSSRCPYAQRVWVAVKYKGLDDVECVEINLSDKPLWYKEKVYPVGKVPSLEHNGQVIGESMDLLNYLDDHFDGPKLMPFGESKREEAAKLLKYADTFNTIGFTGLSMKGASPSKIEEVVGHAFDYLEESLEKYSSEGPFFLGKFGLVDITFAPFIERFELAFSEIRNVDIRAGRPNLAKWIEAADTVDAYSSTKVERNVLVEIYKKMLDSDYFKKVGIVADQSKDVPPTIAVN